MSPVPKEEHDEHHPTAPAAPRRHPRSRIARRPAKYSDDAPDRSKSCAWIRQAYDAGLREIEVGSFVPARLLPQLADTAELVAFAKSLPGLFVSVLVPNLKGAERAIESGADLLLVPLSASDAHSRANVRKTPDEMVDELAKIRAARDVARFEDADRRGRRHGIRMHAAGQRRAAGGLAVAACAAGCRRGPRQHRRHRRLCRSCGRARPVRAGARARGRALLVRPFP